LKEKILKWRYFETGKKQGEIQNKEQGNNSGVKAERKWRVKEKICEKKKKTIPVKDGN
jgi:hypothetical protein